MPKTYDRLNDVTLRMLQALVAISMLGCGAFLGYRWLKPDQSQATSPGYTYAEATPVAAPAQPSVREIVAPQVLMSPDHVFRCETRGRVVYSDHACPDGTARVLKVAPPKNADALRRN